MLAHWEEAPARRAEFGHLAGRWTDLGRAAGTRRVGLRRIAIDPDRWSTPLHGHTAEEEIFYVVAGSGVSLQRSNEDIAFEVRPGDCLVHRAGAEAHTLLAGSDGLEVLAFGTRLPTEIGPLPRAGVTWLDRTWVEAGSGDHPWEREAAAGAPELPPLGERPASVVNVDDLPGESDGSWKRLGAAAGAELTGLNWCRLDPGEEGIPHCHSAEEELYVVLDGGGEIQRWPSPQLRRLGRRLERHPVRAGHVAAFPPGGAWAHGIQAGPDGMIALFYGTREPGDVCYYPRSNKIAFRGLGLIGRLEDLEYEEGEPGGDAAG